MMRVPSDSEIDVTLILDGQRVVVSAEPRRTLAESLRADDVDASVRIGCAEGACGTCTVSLDGRSVRACLVLTVQADGRTITTIDGLGEAVEDLRQALIDHGAFQCGFCASGLVVTAAEYLVELDGDIPTDAQVRSAISGSLCRCTGYRNVVAAIVATAHTRAGAAR